MILMEMHEVFEQKQVSRGVDKIQAYTDTSWRQLSIVCVGNSAVDVDF